MTWVKIDDHFADHPKFLSLGAFAPLAMALQVRALCYCARHLTDGRIPKGAIPILTDGFAAWDVLAEADVRPNFSERSADVAQNGDDIDWPKLMVEGGLWEREKGGFVIHDYLTYNPSRAQVLAERESARARMRENRGSRSPDVRPNFAASSGEVQQPRTRTPTPNTKTAAPRRPSWVDLAAKLWASYHGGTAPYGQLGSQLKPLVKQHGEGEVLRRFANYLEVTDAQFASPARFAQTFGKWNERGGVQHQDPSAPVSKVSAQEMFRRAGLEPPEKMPEAFTNAAAVERAIENHRKRGAA